MIAYALRNRNALLLTSMLLLLLYGLTDVILLSSEALIFFMILFALSTPFSKQSSNNKYARGEHNYFVLVKLRKRHPHGLI